MKTLPFILLVALLGCSHSESPNPATRMSQQLQQWVPKGTPVSTARQLMEQHQFVCTVGSYDSRAAMPPGSDQGWWAVGSFITSDGKTVPVTNITILTCKRADTTNDVCSYEAILTSVDGEFDGTYLVSSARMR